MKKFLLLATLSLASLCMLASCKHTPEEPADPIEYTNGTSEVTIGDFKITAKGATDRIYKSSDKEIILISLVDVDTLNADGTEPDAPEYDLEGNFEGQIINKTKGSVLNLNNVNLTNTDAPAIYGEKKIELKAGKKSNNTITVTGSSEDKIGAITCNKKFELGGSGNITINSSLFHGIKADEVQIKGSGTHVISGSNTEGSAINCNALEVKTSDKVVNVTFKNFRHGIKADKTISILSGNFVFDESIVVPMKTDSVEDDGDNNHSITIGSRTYVTFNGGDEQKANIKTDKLEFLDSETTTE